MCGKARQSVRRMNTLYERTVHRYYWSGEPEIRKIRLIVQDWTNEKQIEEKENIMMQQYEYKCIFILGLGGKTSRILNEYGQQGWELVTVLWAWHYLKRPIQ